MPDPDPERWYDGTAFCWEASCGFAPLSFGNAGRNILTGPPTKKWDFALMKSFSKDQVCECCRIAHDFDERGRLVLAWRDGMPGSIRDHAMVRISPDGTPSPVERLTTDNWMLNGCPHHGPTLALGTAGQMHVVWFTGEGPQGPGTFYARFDGSRRPQATPRRLGPADAGAGHAAIHADGDRVVIAWKEPRGTASS